MHNERSKLGKEKYRMNSLRRKKHEYNAAKSIAYADKKVFFVVVLKRKPDAECNKKECSHPGKTPPNQASKIWKDIKE